VDPLEGELAHLSFIAEELERERLRHEHALRHLTRRKQQAEERLELLVWRRARPRTTVDESARAEQGRLLGRDDGL
jgi:hypothetical protein